MIYFLIYLFLEVMVTSEISAMIGGLNTFALIILTAIAGFIIMANFRFALHENLTRLMKREISQQEFFTQNLFRVVGAILLIIPGFFSDILGVMFQFQPLAMLMAGVLFKGQKTYVNNPHQSRPDQKTRKTDDVIDVEVVDSDSDKTTKKQ